MHVFALKTYGLGVFAGLARGVTLHALDDPGVHAASAKIVHVRVLAIDQRYLGLNLVNREDRDMLTFDRAQD